MKIRKSCLAPLAVLCFSALVPLAQAQQTVNFYNWSDYIAPDTIEKFEAQTGIKVISDYFDSNEMLESKLLTGYSGYDLVVPSFTFMARQAQAGVFQPLDKDKLPNLKHLDPVLLKALSKLDPDNRYGIPYLWGTTGIGYNVEQVKKALGDNAPLNSWELVFKPENMQKLANCGVAFLDTPDEIYPLALLNTGGDVYSKNKKDYSADSAAAKLLSGIRPFVSSFNSSQYINDLASGDICVAIGYSGDILQAQTRAMEANNGVKIAYSIPQQGAAIWFDMLAIPADSNNTEATHKFINFLLQPDIIADVTNYVAYPNANLAAKQFEAPEISGNPSIYPQQAIKERLFIQEIRSPKINNLLTRRWVDLKANR